MAGYKWDQFGGERPIATRLRLGPNEALFANNVDLQSGTVRPRPTQKAWSATLHPSLLLKDTDVPASLFRFTDRSTTDQYWMYWTTDVDVAPGPVENSEQRHYYTGDGVPKMFTKDSITDTTPPYPQAADTKYPKTWFYLGVPAPTAAPGIDGTSYVPPDTAKSGVISGLVTDHFTIRFTPRQPNNQDGSRAMEANGKNATYADSSDGGQVLQVLGVGTRLKVTEIVDANTVRVSGTVGTGYFEELPKFHDDPVPTNIMDTRWDWYYATEGDKPAHFDTTKLYKQRNGKDNDDCWIYLIPDGATLTVTGHAIKVGDIVRITAATDPMRWTTPLRISAGEPFGGSNYNKGRQRNVTDPGSATITFTGDLSYFVERDGREYDPTIEDVVVEAREPTTRAYVYTYVTALGEEGPPSPPTDPFTLALGDSVTINGFTAPPTEHRNITLFRLYRTNTGSQDTAFQFVADVPIGDTSYEDSFADDELSEVLQSETWEPPPATMIGVCAMPNGFLAGFFENVLCFSEPGFPHAWPTDYRMPLDQKVVAIKVISGSLIVATRGTPYVVSGTHPRQMAARKVEEPAPCVDKRSMADCGDVAIYASTDGLVAGSVNGFRNITVEYFSHEQWRELVGITDVVTRNARAWHIDGEYLLFTDNVMPDESHVINSYCFDLRRSDRMTITRPGIAEPRAAFSEPVDGELYYVPSVNDALNLLYEGSLPANSLPILQWRYLYPLQDPHVEGDDIAGRSLCEYRSGIVMLPRPMAIAVAQVICRRTSDTNTGENFGYVNVSILGYRYDVSAIPSGPFPSRPSSEEYHSTELAYVTVIDGDADDETWVGEQRSAPFRVAPNCLVDALKIVLNCRGKVEVEAVYVAETFDDLMLMRG